MTNIHQIRILDLMYLFAKNDFVITFSYIIIIIIIIMVFDNDGCLNLNFLERRVEV
jgi:hypothetical protein